MAITAVIAWVTTKTRLPGRGLLDVLAFVPITIPGLVLGVSMIFQYLSPAFRILPIYGTIWILVLAYVTKYLPYGMRTSSAAMVQIHRELEEAAGVSGASWWTTFRRVTLPLLRPGLVAGWLYIFIVSVRELSASVLLVTSESTVLAVVIFDLFESGKSNAVAALSVMLIVTLVAIVTIVQRLTGRVGIREA
jgi:iron(III) transport system permease protein